MIWKKYTSEKDKVFAWHIGEYMFYVKGEGKAFKVLNEKAENACSNTFEILTNNIFAPEKPWKSFISGKTDSVLLLPSMPDRPIVIKTEHDLQILPGKSVVLYALIPLWVKLYSGTESDQNLLVHLPVVDLSSTWFGETDDGVLSYSLYNPVLFAIDGFDWCDYEALCPIKIINDSNQVLKLERLSLDVSHLKIFSDLGKLVTNEVHFKYKGEVNASDINFAKTAPNFMKEAKLLVREHDPSSKNIIRKGFDFIKTGTTYL